jgi:DUF4097 and DUF4098 domain-containing protein YvlB
MKPGSILRIFLISIALSICLSYSAAPAERYTFPFHKELRTGGNPSLRVRNTSGEIKIESHPENKVIIDAFKVVKADNHEKAKRMADEIEVIIENRDSQIEIKTRYPSRRSRGLMRRLFSSGGSISMRVDYHILVPQEIDLNILGTSGDVSISDISGEVEVNVTSGDLSARRIEGDIDLESTSGDMEIFNVEGDITVRATSSDLEMSAITGNVQISSTSGNTSVEEIAGSVRIDKTSGDVYLDRIRGNIQVSSSSGDLIVDQVEGGLDLETSSGDIEVETEIWPEYEYHAETSSGSIDLTLPEDSDAQVALRTSSGSIKSELPLVLSTISRNSFRGELGSGGPEIHLVTSSGEIKLREYKR